MAIRPDYTTGTVSVENGSTTVTGTGTAFLLAPVRAGDILFDLPGATQFSAVVVTDPTENDTFELTLPWEGPTLSDVTYRIRFQPDGSRYTATATHLMELLSNGNIEAFSALVGALDMIPIFTGVGSLTLIPKSDLINGVRFDVQVPTLADRDPFDGQPAGYSVLVSDTGDGRAAIYTKVSNASGDWSTPAYITGPIGPPIELAVGDTTTLPPGSEATVSNSGTSTAPVLEFGIPAGEGFINRGAYSAGTPYVKGDVVTYNGSSYIAKGATTGNLPTNATYWDLLAAKGQDGTGIGDMIAANDLSDVVNPNTAILNIGGIPGFGTKAEAEAFSPEAAPNFLMTLGYNNPGDGGGALYKKATAYSQGDNLRTVGTAIGNLTGGGGFAAVFDGAKGGAYAPDTGAWAPSVVNGYAGRTFPGGRRVWKATTYGSNNVGYQNSVNVSITINLRGKVGSAPSGSANGTLLGSITFTDSNSDTAARNIISNDNTTLFDHVWCEIVSTDNSGNVCLTELEIYESVLEPSHEGKIGITLDDGATEVWYELTEPNPTPQMFGAFGDGVTSETTQLANLLAYAADGAEIDLGRKNFVFSSLSITKNVTFKNGTLSGTYTAGPVIAISPAVRLTARKVKFKGSGSGTVANQPHMILYQEGLSSAVRGKGFDLEDCEVSGSGGYCIYGKFTDNVRLSRNKISDFAYAGSMFLSCDKGTAENNRVEGREAAYTESYGMSWTHNSYQYNLDPNKGTQQALNPFCAGWIIQNNTVIAPKRWTGIDFHGSYMNIVTGNKVYGAAYGMQLGGSSGDATGYDGHDLIASNNIVTAYNEDGTLSGDTYPSLGIVIQGGGAPPVWRKHRVVLTGNTITGYGGVTPTGVENDTSAAIYANTGIMNFVISDNVIAEWAACAIILSQSMGSGVINNNVFTGTRDSRDFDACIKLVSDAPGRLVVAGNVLTEEGIMPAYGIITSSSVKARITYASDFRAATSGEWGGGFTSPGEIRQAQYI